MSTKLVLVGCGNMGYAMLGGWLASGGLKASETLVVEPAEALRRRAAELGVRTASDAAEIEAGAAPGIVVIAVKPQVIANVVPAYRRFADSGAAFVSVAAGTGIAAFEAMLGEDTPIIRCMPNTPASIGRGMMVVVANDAVAPTTMAFVTELLSASGKVATIDDEALMDAVTAVSGSGPAYVFHFIECLTDAGAKAGLPADIARTLALQTVFGAASLAVDSDDAPAELRRQVTSPNGTTAAALAVLMGDDALKRLVEDAVEAARARSVELGK